MQYYVIAPDGQKYGPADVATLAQWAQDGRLDASTMLESALDATRVPAASVPGIIAPTANPYSAPGPGAGTGPQQFAQYQRASVDDGSTDVRNSWIFGAIAIICCGFILGPIGIYYGNQAVKKGHPGGRAAMIFSIVTTVVWCLLFVLRFAAIMSAFNGRR